MSWQAALPSYDKLTAMLRSLVAPYMENRGHLVSSEEISHEERKGLVASLDSGTMTVFCGHGFPSKILIGEDVEIRKRDVGGAWNIFLYTCSAGSEFGERIDTKGGSFIGYSEAIPFAVNRSLDGLAEIFRGPVEVIVRHGVDVRAKSALKVWYRNSIEKLEEEENPDEFNLLWSMALEEHLDTIS